MHPEGPAAVWAESLEGKKNKNENYLSSAKIKTGAFINLWWVLHWSYFNLGFDRDCVPDLTTYFVICAPLRWNPSASFSVTGRGATSVSASPPPRNSITLDWWGAQIRPQMRRRAVLIRCGRYTVAFYKWPRPLHSDRFKSAVCITALGLVELERLVQKLGVKMREKW